MTLDSTILDDERLRPLPAGFAVENHHLCIGGKRLVDLADQAGGPLYVYSRDAIKERIARLRQALPKDVHLHYAVKANPMPAVVDLIAGLVDGLDVASGGEIDLVTAVQHRPAHVSFAGPGKTDQELERAVGAGVTVNLESGNEMRRLGAIAAQMQTRPSVAIRVNPAFELRQSGMRMGGGSKPFGIDEEQVPDVLRELISLPLEFAGFHIFAGSQNLSEEALAESQQATIDLAIRLSNLAAPASINLGGGFGVPYFPGDTPLDMERVGQRLDGLLQPLRQAQPQARLVLELGRYLVAGAGLYVTRIVDRKGSRGTTYLVTEGGLNHHLALSGNFGQVIRKNYPVGIAHQIDVLPQEHVDIVGSLCTPLDRLGDNVALPRADIGDFVVVFQSGAYGASASPAGFLSHPPAAEFLV